MLAKSNIAVKLLEAVKYPNYDDENVESDPLFCPWCAEYFEKDKDLDDEYEDDE